MYWLLVRRVDVVIINPAIATRGGCDDKITHQIPMAVSAPTPSASILFQLRILVLATLFRMIPYIINH